jgi:hypothetical protein
MANLSSLKAPLNTSSFVVSWHGLVYNVNKIYEISKKWG